MQFSFGFYSSLLLITFSQGIIFSMLLLKKGIENQVRSDFWLSAFLFLCSLFIAPWMLGFAGWYNTQPYRDILFYVPFQHLFWMGPIIYCYTQSLLNPSFRLTLKNSYHFLPGLCYLLYNIWIWVYDCFIYRDYYYYSDGTDKDFDTWYQYLGFCSMMIYFLLSIRYYNLYKKILVQVRSDAYELLFSWIKKYLYAFLVMIVLRLIHDIAGAFIPFFNTYEGSWWFFLMYSIVLYYIAITGYSNNVSAKIPYELSVFNPKPVLLLANQSLAEENTIDIAHEVYSESPSVETLEWKEKIDTIIREEKLYENPELSLTDLSKKLKINVAFASKLINQGFGQNFNDVINLYRIEAIKKNLENGEHKKSTLLGIAFDCGFNSKATFNRAFKKHTGSTPKEYLKRK